MEQTQFLQYHSVLWCIRLMTIDLHSEATSQSSHIRFFVNFFATSALSQHWNLPSESVDSAHNLCQSVNPFLPSGAEVMFSTQASQRDGFGCAAVQWQRLLWRPWSTPKKKTTSVTNMPFRRDEMTLTSQVISRGRSWYWSASPLVSDKFCTTMTRRNSSRSLPLQLSWDATKMNPDAWAGPFLHPWESLANQQGTESILSLLPRPWQKEDE